MRPLKGGLQWSDIDSARRLSDRQKRSRKLGEFKCLAHQCKSDHTYSQWQNDIYDVIVRRYDGYTTLGICNFDGSARHDWRDFQAIKNRFVGDEWEAVELYPAESRLVDPSNFYILWCRKSWSEIGMHDGRRIATEKTAIAPQRGWVKEIEPEPNYGIK